MVHGLNKRTMATDCRVFSEAQSATRNIRTSTRGQQSHIKWHPMDTSNRRSLGRSTPSVSFQKHMPPTFPTLDRIRRFRQDSNGISQRFTGSRWHRSERRFHRWNLCPGKKRGDGVGKTKRGKGTKIMGLTDAKGLPIAVDTASASPHEVTLVEATLDACFLEEVPENVIGDKAYDSDPLDERLAKERNVSMIAPHKSNRDKPPTQDGRPLRRYKRRYKVERLFAWLQNFRRLVVRYEYHLENFLAMVQLGCIIILLRRVLG